MSDIMNALEQHLVKSLPEYIALLGLLLVAVVANQPHPDVITKWLGAFQEVPLGASKFRYAWQKFVDLLAILYKWGFDSIQAFMSARNPTASVQVQQHLSPPPTYVIQTPPASVAPPTTIFSTTTGTTAVDPTQPLPGETSKI